VTRKLARSAGLIGIATLSSRVLGLVRDAVIARFFGTDLRADAFAAATRFPTLLRDLFAEGAMSAALVPTFTRTLQKDGKEAAWRLGSQVINALLLVTGLIVVGGIVFAWQLVDYYAKGFREDPVKVELTVQLAQVTMPFLTLVAVAAGFMGMLNALKRFFIPASSPALFNVAFILCTVVLVPLFSRIGIEPALALALGMLAGGFAQIATQWPALRQEGYRHQWTLKFNDPRLREMLFLMGPGSLGVAAAQINLFVSTMLASYQPGGVAALGFAFRLMYMPIGIFGVSVATAAIPDLARHAADGKHNDMRTTLSWGLRLMLMLSVPATFGLMVLATPIVQLIYERGVFNPDSTALVAQSLAFYAPGIVGYSIVKIASPSFYSLGDARTPMVVSLVTIAANLVLNLSLNALVGFRGLALGTAIAANINAGLLLWLLSRRIGGIEARRVAWSFAKITLASIVMAGAAMVLQPALEQLMPGRGTLLRSLKVGMSISGAMGVLAVAAWVLRIEEFHQAVQQVLARIKPRQAPNNPG
jgi:putative peptidoglycan lipid II flippase